MKILVSCESPHRDIELVERRDRALVSALEKAGHEARLVIRPHRQDCSPEALLESIDGWKKLNPEYHEGIEADLFIATTVPACFTDHPNRVAWLNWYELWASTADAPHGWRQCVERISTRLAHTKLFVLSSYVAERLAAVFGAQTRVLLHPSPDEVDSFHDEARPFILAPGALIKVNRHHLALEALALTRYPVQMVFPDGGEEEGALIRLAQRLGIADRVVFLSGVNPRARARWFANTLAVFYGPIDKDYGYPAIRAALSNKPLVTCFDSGGPLMFVVDEVTGYVSESTGKAIASSFDTLWRDFPFARRLGENAREFYRGLNVSWDVVVNALTGEKPYGTEVWSEKENSWVEPAVLRANTSKALNNGSRALLPRARQILFDINEA